MAVVVRCPVCRGLSQVGEADLGLTVQCPRCDAMFAAVAEDVPSPPPPPVPPSVVASETVSPAPDKLEREIEPPAPSASPPVLELELELEEGESGGGGEAALPHSVLIGLALLPFAIPVLWLVGPTLFGESPALSLATPLALAFSTSALCLAVIGTVDWRPATRVKGVLVLVALSYLTGFGLYFLKKEMVDRLKRLFGTEQNWVEYRPPGGGYRVRLPPGHRPLPLHQPLGLAELTCRMARHHAGLGQVYTVVVGHGRPLVNRQVRFPGSDAWFDQAVRELVESSGGQLRSSRPVTQQQAFPGREVEIQLGGGVVRVVRVVVARNRVYYLAIEGAGLHADDELATELFGSFLIEDAE